MSLTIPAQTPRRTKRNNASRPRQSTTPGVSHWIDRLVAMLLLEVSEMADPGQAPSAVTILNFLKTLGPYVIGLGAAFLSSYLTMKNARKLQAERRRAKAKAVASLLRSDLHNKLVALAAILSRPGKIYERSAYETVNSKRVFESALPRLGDLNHYAAASVLTIFDTIPILLGDALDLPANESQQRIPQVRSLARVVGQTIHLFQRHYELDPLHPLEEGNVDLKAIGLRDLKDLGL